MEISKIPTSYLILIYSRSCNMYKYKQLSLYVDISNKILSIYSSYLLQKYALLQFASATWYRIDSSISYHISYQWFSISSCHTMYQLYDTMLTQTLLLPSCHQKQILWLKLWYPVLRMYHTSIHNNLATSRCRKMMCRLSVQIKQPTAIIAPSHCHQWKER